MTGRRTGSRTVAATAVLTGCALLLAGCGIKRTGVIESGHAATVKKPGGQVAVLYYVSQEGDRLVPVPFVIEGGYTIAPKALVRLLLDGPTGPAQQAGLTTALPRLTGIQAEQVSVGAYVPGRGLTVRMPLAVGGLSEQARRQLVCTLGVSAVPDVLSPVALQGTDAALPPAECDARR
ncbi:hypothetical protein ACFWUZ_00430 [Streptomyces sp. NPDC058646]|uniref:hypothetical protein n=1 Tax=Streptomyces sp. NPDC058646 TaxID=3346574 RepID=UPI00365914B8